MARVKTIFTALSPIDFYEKVSATMRLLSEYDGKTNGKGVLDLKVLIYPGSTYSVRDVLVDKQQPSAATASL